MLVESFVIGTCQMGSCLLSGCVQVQNPWKTILSRKYRPQLVLAAASTFFQQWTGINTIIFYAPQLFVSLGVGEGAALGATIVTGIVNHLATYVSFHVADKYGRRILFIEGENCVCAFICRFAAARSQGTFKYPDSQLINFTLHFQYGNACCSYAAITQHPMQQSTAIDHWSVRLLQRLSNEMSFHRWYPDDHMLDHHCHCSGSDWRGQG